MANLTVDSKLSKSLPTPRKTLPPDAAGEFALFGWFAFLTPQAAPLPEVNFATIPLVPNAWIVSAFPVEVGEPNYLAPVPFIGAARFEIESVEVDVLTQTCQVIFNQSWVTSLPCGLNMIIGYIPEDTLSER